MNNARLRQLAGLEEATSDAEFEKLKKEIRETRSRLNELQKKYRRLTGRNFEG